MIFVREFDVAVVGAGPAGSAAAEVLGAAGLSVGLFDKSQFPRYKTCGGGLLQRTLRRIPFSVSSVVERDCFQAEFHHHCPDLSFRSQRTEAVVSMVMRERFDHLLTEHSCQQGTTLLQETRLKSLRVEPDRIILETTKGDFSAAFVIGADGVNSVVARAGGFPELRQVVPALECEVWLEPEIAAPFWAAARFDFGLTPFGYGWVFPKRDHLSIGVLTTRKGSCNLNLEYQRYLSALRIHKVVTEEKHGYMIPLRPRRRLFAQPRILLVGDAAGLADPVTAEGISAAILSGQIAARAIIENRGNYLAVQQSYKSALTENLLRDLRAARWLATVLYRFPKIRGRVMERHGQRLTEFMTDVVTGRSRYRDIFSHPSFYWKAIFGRTR